MNIEKIVEFIHYMDNKNIVVDFKNEEIYIWNISRFLINIELQKDLGFNFSEVKAPKTKFITILFNTAMVLKKNEEDAVLLSEKRYCDTASRLLDLDKIVYYTPEKTKGNPFNSLFALYSKYISYLVKNNSDVIVIINKINLEFYNFFGYEKDFSQIIKNCLIQFLYKRKIMSLILKKNKKVKTIYVMPFTFNEYTATLGIDVIEIQHGAIDRNHIAYSYGENSSKKYINKKMYIWDEFWDGVIDYCDVEILPKKKLQKKHYNYYDALVISQFTISDKIFDLAVNLCKDNDLVAIKMHPNEKKNLNNIPMNLHVFHNEIQLDELIKISKSVYGAYSTGLFEALEFEKEVYVMKDECILQKYLESDKMIKI